MSKLILNFGHELSGHALEGIRDEVGENVIANIRPYLGLNAPVGEQVFRACREAVALYGKPDYIIPPASGMAGLFVGRFFTTIEGFPPVVTYVPVIRLVPLAGNVPMFAFGGVEQ